MEEPLLEAQLLMAHAIGIERSRLLAMLRDALPADARPVFEEYVSRRAAREPSAYITGKREFYGHPFVVSASVLIPRPETELLVEVAVEHVREISEPLIADVGTGSGAVAVSVALALPRGHVVATDTSAAALEVAAANARSHGVDGRVRLVQADLLGGESGFDVVLANLPYVSEGDWAELEPEVRDWEPLEALVGGERGTEVIERLLAGVGERVRAGGVIAAEFGVEQGARLMEVARVRFPDGEARVRTDMAGIDRVLVITT